MTQETRISPQGEIVFMNLTRAFQARDKKGNVIADSTPQYTCRLRFPNSEKDFKEYITGINDASVVDDKEHPGHYLVRAKSRWQPTVLGVTGEQLDGAEIPEFRKGATGTAIMKVSPHRESGSLNLVQVGITSLDLSNVEETASGSGLSATVADLKAAMQKTRG